MKVWAWAASVCAAVLLLTAFAWRGPDPATRGLRVFSDMVDSPANEAYDFSLPPEGSIPRGWMPFRYGPDEAEAVRAGVELVNPFASDPPEAVARGGVVYRNHCIACHGPGGLGDGPSTRLGVPPPPSLLAENARAMPDGRVFHLITWGRGNMRSYRTQVPPDDRWRAIRWIRRMQSEAR